MQLETLCDRLDDELNVTDYADADAVKNGLQVDATVDDIHHVVLAVDAAEETIERAAATADLLVTHHGITFGGIDRVTGLEYNRLRTLFEMNLPLYVAHLPLDGHQELGNAAQLGNVLELTDRQPFGDVDGQPVGQRGRLPAPLDVDALVDRLYPHLDIGDGWVRTLGDGPDQIQDVAIVTGSGVDFLEEAAEEADVLITGEGKQHAYHEANERGIHLILAGHYATETFGVKALGDRLEQWELETTFLECPTGI